MDRQKEKESRLASPIYIPPLSVSFVFAFCLSFFLAAGVN